MRNERSDLAFRILPVADRVEEEILARAHEGGGAALGVGLLTLRDLEQRLLAAARLAPIDALTAELIAAEVAPGAAEGTCYQGVGAEPGFARAFLAVWDALRDGGCDLEELGRLAARVEGLAGKRLRAIEKVAVAYEAACAARGLVDGPGARLALLARLPGLELPGDLARASILTIEDVVELPVSRLRLLEGLAKRGLRVVFQAPALGGRSGLAASMEALLRPLEAEAPSVQVVEAAVGGGALASFHARLFDPELPATAAPVEVIEGDDPRAEVRAVVRVVRRWLRAGVPPDSIAIAARGMAGMRGRLGAALEAAGIPWRDRRGLPAAEAPPVAVALAVLEAAERAFPREELGEILLSRYVEGAVNDDAGRIPAREILQMLREAASRDDRAPGHAARLQELARRRREDDPKEADRIERVARHLGPLLDGLRMQEEAPLAHHVQRFADGLDRLGLYRRSRAAEESETGPVAVDLQAAQAVARDQAALRALTAALGAVAGAARRAGLADRPVSLSRFRDLLVQALSQASLPPRGARGGAVRLLDVSELPGRRLDHLVICGVVDGRFPGGKVHEPLLDDWDREAITLAAGRRIFRWRGAEEPLLFALSAAAAREQLVVTASRSDEGGRDAVRSPFFAETLAALGREEPLRERAAIVPSAVGSVSEAELRTRSALLAAGASPAPDDAPVAAILEAGKTGHLVPVAARAFSPGVGEGAGGRLALPEAVAAAVEKVGQGAERFGEGVVWASSNSALESYAACPFRFFASRVLSLPEPEGAEDDLDVREHGNVLHEVAADVFAALRDRGLLPLQGGERAELELQVAREAADAALDRWERTQRTGPAPFWSLRRADAHAAIARLLAAEVQRGSELVPAELEVAFGSEGAAPLLLPAPTGPETIAVRGRVDRVDRAPDGSAVEVIDYKSGKVDSRVSGKDLGRTSFQLPIYVAWAREHFGAEEVDAFLLSLRDGGTSKSLGEVCANMELPVGTLIETDPGRRAAARNGPLEPAAGADELPDDGDPNLADAAWAFYLAMREGRFDVAPAGGRSKGCQYCVFATVCRIGGDA